MPQKYIKKEDVIRNFQGKYKAPIIKYPKEKLLGASILLSLFLIFYTCSKKDNPITGKFDSVKYKDLKEKHKFTQAINYLDSCEKEGLITNIDTSEKNRLNFINSLQ
jgi:hypothetical protein